MLLVYILGQWGLTMGEGVKKFTSFLAKTFTKGTLFFGWLVVL